MIEAQSESKVGDEVPSTELEPHPQLDGYASCLDCSEGSYVWNAAEKKTRCTGCRREYGGEDAD